MSYVLHIGALPRNSTPARLDDPLTGFRLLGNDQQEVKFGLVDDATDLSFTVLCTDASWFDWGQRGLNDGTLHFMVQFRHEPSARQVQIIYRDLEENLTSGRLHDVAILTNAENWSQTDTYYLFNTVPGPIPVMVPISPEPGEP